MGKDYKETLNLPSRDFPMRANLSEREPEQIEKWQKEEVYEEMIARRQKEDAERFILHDGPPYANGNIHHGHILNKTLKDFVVKYRNMAGYLCEYVPGWDCHGLPIEHEVDQQLGDEKLEMSTAQIRRACREYADKWVGIQADEFQRIMLFGDWDHPYTTMSYDYEATIVRELGRFFEEGIVYRGLKPVHWDWAAKTALAEAEVEYDEFRTEHVYVKFPLEELPDELAEAADGRDAYVLIWTTTPWTLPANLAIALHPDLNYQLIDHEGDALIMAEGLRDAVLADCDIADEEIDMLANFEGRALVGELGAPKGLSARHAWLDRASVLLPADYVTLEQGTGCVHTAPGHGQEDFALGRQHGLDVLCPVDQEAKFTIDLEVEADDGAKNLRGMHVLTANKYIAQHLSNIGRLLNEAGDRITIPRYPYGWRTKKPVIFRATTQWFIAMEPESAGQSEGIRLRERALEAIDEIDWIPDWGRERIEGMVESRPDWCISRQRSWGVPITVMYCNECDTALTSPALFDHVAGLVEEHGADVWFEREAAELVPEGASCAECGASDFRKEEDILDVWFDSGVSWAAVLEGELGWGNVADLYLEGSDQHRGWFQSSLLCGVGTRGEAPYRACLTHGFVTDEDGHKYSKSSKNFEPPEQMLEEYGAEILRLWVAAVDYKGDITLSDEILDRIADGYRKIRNTFRFLINNLYDFEPSAAVAYEDLEPIDRFILHRTGEVVERVEQAYDNYDFHVIYHTTLQFMTVDMSNLYMNIAKDRLYCELPDSRTRRAAQTVYWRVLSALARAAAPILSFTCEEAWQHMPHGDDAPDSVFLADFPNAPKEWRDDRVAGRWESLLEVRRVVQRALEQKRQSDEEAIGSSQEAHVTVTASGKTFSLLNEAADQLEAFFIVSQVTVEEGDVDGDEPVEVTVEAADGEKCPRCWNYWVEPGSDDEVCARCRQVISELD
ncbi:MAG: isoleucine--tRNA ligase [Persicimonas sp.]